MVPAALLIDLLIDPRWASPAAKPVARRHFRCLLEIGTHCIVTSNERSPWTLAGQDPSLRAGTTGEHPNLAVTTRPNAAKSLGIVSSVFRVAASTTGRSLDHE